MKKNYGIETPQQRHANRKNSTRTLGVLDSWCRVYAPDKSTAAYCPDEVTARLIAQALTADDGGLT